MSELYETSKNVYECSDCTAEFEEGKQPGPTCECGGAIRRIRKTRDPRLPAYFCTDCPKEFVEGKQPGPICECGGAISRFREQ